MTFAKVTKLNNSRKRASRIFDMASLNDIDYAAIARGHKQNIIEVNKDLAMLQNDKNLKFYANLTMTSGYGHFTPPSES